MKKKIFAMLCVLFLLGTLALPVSAAAPRLDDQADLLTASEETALLGTLDEISTRQGMDVVVVTVDSTYGQSVTAYADDYYDENGYSPDGVLLLISIYDREWSVSTAGFGITAFTDAGLDYLAEQFVDALSEGEYYDACDTFARLSDEFITQAKEGSAFDRGNLPKAPFGLVKRLLTALVVGFVVALIVTGVMKSKLKTVYSQPAAAEYVRNGSMQLTDSRELFLYTHVTRQKREKSNSGGSSTHVSSSGRTHGGSSGRF